MLKPPNPNPAAASQTCLRHSPTLAVFLLLSASEASKGVRRHKWGTRLVTVTVSLRTDGDFDSDELNMEQEEDDFDDEHDGEEEDEESENEEEDGREEGEEENGDEKNDNKDAKMEELVKEYMNLRNQEQDILKNLKHHKDEDLLKGQAVKNQKEPVRSLFCDSHQGVSTAYSDLVDSSKRTLDSLAELQEALFEKNPSLVQATDSKSGQSKKSESSKNIDDDGDEDWSQISQLLSRIATFRDKSINKWQRKTEVTTEY